MSKPTRTAADYAALSTDAAARGQYALAAEYRELAREARAPLASLGRPFARTPQDPDYVPLYDPTPGA